ncbi:uncharacterized protein N7479_003171 [Penicillium vulpinum]|uniref:Uncharacterized protein n=1 Tax=Penicillium vulpinum TaxID=29845 RepID=A0A1V6S4F7_9EURO|nr:uncharacterized protein N7479_003171 [Penicillium vulpinum]KAJ5963295.1 hypothetical protein N7479_003171 [Penicillium vulpinum]OQE08503.1 hypothetical protein PENVUL_c009G09791 [Penicillium vulpinum]
MSAQSPHPPTPKGSRNNRRPQKKNMTPHAPKPALLSTPPSSPPHTMNPGVNQMDSSNNPNSLKKKPLRSGKKPRDNKPSPAPHSGYHSNTYNSGPRYTPTHPAVTSPPTKPSTAYAGPTFHASPAPSALPIPSFFSKSAPDSNLVPPIETDSDDAEVDPEPEVTPSKPRNRNNKYRDEEHKPSPLDFLFKAAVQARDQKSTSNPEVNKVLQSPQTEPKASRPNPDNIFSFEMGSSDSRRNSHIGPSFAPSYQDRMNALRPSNTPQSSDMTEEERRIKTEELKHLLLNPPPQKPPSSTYASQEYAGSFGPRPSNVPPYATPMRTSSGPQLTMSHGSFSPHQLQQQQVPQNTGHSRYPYPGHSHSPLRREVDLVPPPSMPPYRGPASTGTSNAASPAPYGNPYMAASQYQRTSYASPQQSHASAAFQMPMNSPSPSRVVDTRQIENDIRRVLKLDTSGPPVTQSSA